MRVVNSSMNRKFGVSVNDVHSKLNKSMNKISSGKAYENAAQNPLAYYEGMKIDNQYQDTLSKLALNKDVKNRLYQQELGARSIQKTLADAKVKLSYIRSDTNNEEMKTVETIRQDLLQKQQSMVNDLNTQYRSYYIFGGNDISSAPFKLSADGKILTFTHQFTDGTTKSIDMELQANGSYTISDPASVFTAMTEQGRVDVGYGTISDRSTLLDTYTNGLNLLTGLTSDALRTMKDAGGNPTQQALDLIQKWLDKSPIGLIGQAVIACDDYMAGGDKGDFSSKLGDIMDEMTVTEHTVSTVYSDLGNKYSLLETTETKLTNVKQALTEQYKDKLGADPYEAIMEMYSYQYSYSSSLQLGSKLMQSSLFDFIL